MCYRVSKLFRAYGLYNAISEPESNVFDEFQSSFELMGYITGDEIYDHRPGLVVSKLFRAYGLYNW